MYSFDHAITLVAILTIRAYREVYGLLNDIKSGQYFERNGPTTVLADFVLFT